MAARYISRAFLALSQKSLETSVMDIGWSARILLTKDEEVSPNTVSMLE